MESRRGLRLVSLLLRCCFYCHLPHDVALAGLQQGSGSDAQDQRLKRMRRRQVQHPLLSAGTDDSAECLVPPHQQGKDWHLASPVNGQEKE